MKNTSSTQENNAVPSQGNDMKPVPPIHIEETPCVVIEAVRIVHEFAQPRTMHAWLT
jgi:hypothetical protein